MLNVEADLNANKFSAVPDAGSASIAAFAVRRLSWLLKKMKFAHLHCHSHYSLLDGLSKIDPLVERAKELGMESLAITDHGVMYGTIEFYNKCKELGIKPIIGLEAYIAPRSMADKEGKVDSDYFHLT